MPPGCFRRFLPFFLVRSTEPWLLKYGTTCHEGSPANGIRWKPIGRFSWTWLFLHSLETMGRFCVFLHSSETKGIFSSLDIPEHFETKVAAQSGNPWRVLSFFLRPGERVATDGSCHCFSGMPSNWRSGCTFHPWFKLWPCRTSQLVIYGGPDRLLRFPALFCRFLKETKGNQRKTIYFWTHLMRSLGARLAGFWHSCR